MIDRYSRWLEMAFFRNTPTTATTTRAMRAIFANKGVPSVCQSDNGSPFQAQEMDDFAQSCGYYHHRITPEWPRANGTVARFNRSMKMAIQAAHLEGVPFRDAAQRFIEMYIYAPQCNSCKPTCSYAWRKGDENHPTNDSPCGHCH